MNWIDVVFLACVGISALTGARQGFSRSGLGLIAVIAGFLAAAWFYPAQPVGFVLVFGAVVGLSCMACHLLGRWLRGLDIDWLDQPLGAVFGAVNGALTWLVLVVALMTFGPSAQRDVIASSQFAPYALDSIWAISEAVPPEMKSGVRESYRSLQERLPPKFRKRLPELRSHEI